MITPLQHTDGADDYGDEDDDDTHTEHNVISNSSERRVRSTVTTCHMV